MVTFRTPPAASNGSSPRSVAITVVTGDRIVVGVGGYIVSSLSAGMVTDNQSHTWTLDEAQSNAGDGAACGLWSTISTYTGTITITFTSISAVATMNAIAWSNPSTSDIDVGTHQRASGATSISTGTTGTTNKADEVVVAAFGHIYVLGNTITAFPSGYTNVGYSNAARGGSMDYQQVSATGTFSAGWTLTAATSYGAAIHTYKVDITGLLVPSRIITRQSVNRKAFY